MCSGGRTVAIRAGHMIGQIGGIIWRVQYRPRSPRFEVAQLARLRGRYHVSMDGPIIFTCPTTGARVQHWLDKRDQVWPNDHEMVVCPACAKIHFINRQTGQPLGHKNQQAQ
jgi:hypothetical protein